MGRREQDGSLAEQPVACGVAHAHATELAPEDAVDAVVASEAFVDERVVAVHQVEDAAVLSQHALEEEFGLTLKRLTKVVVEIREQVRVRDDAAKVAQVQPLPGEVVDERG